MKDSIKKYKTVADTGLTDDTYRADTTILSGMFQIKQLINPNNVIISTVDFKNSNYSL